MDLTGESRLASFKPKRSALDGRRARQARDRDLRSFVRHQRFCKGRDIEASPAKGTETAQTTYDFTTSDDPMKMKLMKWRQEKAAREAASGNKKKRPFVVGKATANAVQASGIHKPFSPFVKRQQRIRRQQRRAKQNYRPALGRVTRASSVSINVSDKENSAVAASAPAEQSSKEPACKPISRNLSNIFSSHEHNANILANLMSNLDFGIKKPMQTKSQADAEAETRTEPTSPVPQNHQASSSSPVNSRERTPLKRHPALAAVEEQDTVASRTRGRLSRSNRGSRASSVDRSQSPVSHTTVTVSIDAKELEELTGVANNASQTAADYCEGTSQESLDQPSMETDVPIAEESKDVHVADSKAAELAKGAQFFRQLRVDTQDRLRVECEMWQNRVNEAEQVSTDAAEDIRAAIGQADLLCRKKLQKFEALCSRAEATEQGLALDSVDGDSRKVEHDDLEGYWEACIMPQIEDVQARFEKIQELANNGWTQPDSKPVAPKKKRVKAESSEIAGAGNKKPSKPKASRRARGGGVRDFIAKMRQQQKEKEEHADSEADTGNVAKGVSGAFNEPIAASVTLLTPVRATKKEAEEFGTSTFLTPVRRSTRKTPSRFRVQPQQQGDVGNMLETTNYGYKPNPHLAAESTRTRASVLNAQLFSASKPPAGCSDSPVPGLEASMEQLPAASFESPVPTRRMASSAAATPPDTLSKLLFGGDDAGQDEAKPSLTGMDSPMTADPAPSSPLVAITPARMVTPARKAAASVSKLGSVVRFATTTPAKHMRDLLGTDTVVTPVRRSARLNKTASHVSADQVSQRKAGTLAFDSLDALSPTIEYGYMPNQGLGNQ